LAEDDRSGIVDTVSRCTIAMNSRQWAMYDDIMTSDCLIDFGVGNVWRDRETFVRGFSGYHNQFDVAQHINSNHVVTISGDEAHCLSYVQGCIIRHAAVGGSVYETAGWYDDRLIRTPDGWRIAERRFRMIRWSGNPAVVQRAETGESYSPTTFALHTEAAKGAVGYFEALRDA